MRPTPFFSIIVPVSDTKFLRDTLFSCAWQTFRDFEVVLSLDCDEDAVRFAVSDVEEFLADVSVVIVRNPRSPGEYENLFSGIEAARGLFIKPLYHDDLLLPFSLIEIHRFFSNHRECDFCFNARLPINEKSELLAEVSPAFSPLFDAGGIIRARNLYGRLRYIRFLNQIGEPSSGCFRANMFEGFTLDRFLNLALLDNGTKLRRLGDLTTWINLSRTHTFGYLPIVLNYFRFHQTSRTSTVIVSPCEYQDNINQLFAFIDRLRNT